MHKINGFSNEFYGWGGEDDDIFHRIQDAKINVHREPANIARFTMLLHGKVFFETIKIHYTMNIRTYLDSE